MRADDGLAPVRVLYIVGAGRSGSTALDTVLGSHRETEGVGELAKLIRSYSGGEYCACGRRATSCELWSEVWQRWAAAAGADPAIVYPPLQSRFERLRYAPGALLASRRGSGRFAAYTRLTRELFEAVARVSGRRVIVDSSKSPGRALALARVPGLDLRLIHLVRDCRGVAYSASKAFERDLHRGLEQEIRPRPANRTAWAWLASNLTAAWVARAVPPEHRVRVRYEDLVTRPAAVLGEIGRAAGIDTTRLAAAVESGEEVETGHTISGNRIRMRGRLRLVADFEWMERMPERDRAVVWRLCGGLLRRYGYQR